MPFLVSHDRLLLAGATEIFSASSAADAERQLAAGFRPRAVLLELGADLPRGEALAARMASHPACAAVPILGVWGDDERLRLTLLNCAGTLSSPSQLSELLRVVEDLCLDLPRPSLEDPGELAC